MFKKDVIPPYIVPLSSHAQEIVKQLLNDFKPAQKYLFPGALRLTDRMSENTVNFALKRMGFDGRLTGHGLRATMSTALNEIGYPKAWVDAHTFQAVYDQWLAHRKLSLEEGRQTSLEQIARVFKKDVFPVLRHLTIYDITRAHLLDIIGKVEKRGSLSVAEKLRIWLVSSNSSMPPILKAMCCTQGGVFSSRPIAGELSSLKNASTLPWPASKNTCMYGSGALVEGTWSSAMASTKSMLRCLTYHSTVSLASRQR